jgi:hypothetical protein
MGGELSRRELHYGFDPLILDPHAIPIILWPFRYSVVVHIYKEHLEVMGGDSRAWGYNLSISKNAPRTSATPQQLCAMVTYIEPNHHRTSNLPTGTKVTFDLIRLIPLKLVRLAFPPSVLILIC